MPRNGKLNNKSAMHRATTAVKRLFTRAGVETDVVHVSDAPSKDAPEARTTRKLETDIPFDVLDAAYMPPVTSSKASFRSDGSDHQLDQEFSVGRTANDWNDEDRYTNKSGDPRIGTHGRTNEPDEARVEERE